MSDMTKFSFFPAKNPRLISILKVWRHRDSSHNYELSIDLTLVKSGKSENTFCVQNSYFRLKYLSRLLESSLYKVCNSPATILYPLARRGLTLCFLPFSACLLALLCTISTLLQVGITHFCMAFLCNHQQNKLVRNIFMFHVLWEVSMVLLPISVGR